MPRRSAGLAVLTLVVAAVSARANGPFPPTRFLSGLTPRKDRVELQPTVGEDGQARIRLPAYFLKMKTLDEERGRRRAAFMPASTVMVGIALTLALASGGLWLARSKNQRWLGGAGLLLAGVAVLGVSGCPVKQTAEWNTYPDKIEPLTLRPDGSLVGFVLLEADATDEVVHIALPYETLKAIGAKAAEPRPDVNP